MTKKILEKDERRNKVPNDFFGIWENVRELPYKMNVEKQVRKLKEITLMNAIRFEQLLFPKNVQRDLEINQNHYGYWLGVQSTLKDSEWWAKSKIKDALRFFLQVASDNIKYFRDNYNDQLFQEKLTQKNRNELFALYQMTTLFFAWSAQREKKLRVIMGIRKSFLFK
jgi:hypothetical protein